jgi:CubicO group peptidase (beta-lactamase class C family)
MNIRSLWVALIALLLALPAAATDPLPRAKPESVGMSSAGLARIGEVLRADIERGRIPGAVVAIARKGKLVYFDAFGYRDKAASVPMTTNTIFSIASMTKPMVTVGALQLYEQGRLSFDDPVSNYLPQFAKMQIARMDPTGQAIIDTVPAARQITIQDIMRHTSGIIYGGRGSTAVHKLYPASSSAAAVSMTSVEFLDTLGSLPLMYQPGTVWDYGFSIDVLGLVVESITNQTLGQYLQESLFKPLGMSDTGFVVPADKVNRYAKELPNDPDTGKPQSLLDLTKPTKFECGGGCAVSTASDYLRFAQMLLNHGKIGSKQILSRKTVEFMTADQLWLWTRHCGAAHGRHRALDGLCRRFFLARRKRHELVGGPQGRACRRVYGALARPDPLALSPVDQRTCTASAGLKRTRTLATSAERECQTAAQADLLAESPRNQ